MTAIDWEREEGGDDFDHERAYKRARRRAERKADLYGELVKYAIVTGLLLVFLRPVGVIVMLLWGYKLLRRYSDLEWLPGMRRRWVDEELQRQAFGGGQEEDWEPGAGRVRRRRRRRRHPEGNSSPRGKTRAGALVSSLGDDPASQENIGHARQALRDVDQVVPVESPPGDPVDETIEPPAPRLRDLSMAAIVDSALERVRPRAQQLGVEIVRDADTDGPMHGDAEKLRWVVIHIMDAVLDSFERSPVDGPRIEIALGENLASTRVWLRVRDNSAGVDEKAIHPIVRSFYSPSDDDAEFQLDFSKRDGEPTRGH